MSGCHQEIKGEENERTKHNAPDLKHTQEKSAIGKPSGPQKRHVVSEAKEKFEKQPEVVDRKLPGSKKEEIVQQEVVDDDILMMFKGMPVRKKEMPNFSIKDLSIPKAEQKRPYYTHERLSLDRVDPKLVRNMTEKELEDYKDQLERDKAIVTTFEKFEMEQEKATRKKVCTQSVESLNQIDEMYRQEINSEISVIITKDTEYKKELSKFIAKSFKAWNWHTDAEHKNYLKHWNGMLKNDDFTPLQKNWIRYLIKQMKQERATAIKQFTNEFQFTRRTMCKGIKYVREKNMFLARLVYREFDSKDEENQILSEEETPIKESWVREEFSPEFVRHIINMREFNHYNEVPQDIEIWIGKHKIRRVRYLLHREKSLIDYPSITRKLLNHLKSISKKRKKGNKV